MSINRRSFLKSGTTLVAGAALGALGTIGVQRGLREYGPVTLWTPFLFCKDPISIKSEIFSDEREGKFGIRVFGDRGKVDGILEASLTDVRETLRYGERKTVCLCFGSEKKVVRMPIAIVAEGDRVTFLMEFGKNDSHPFWMNRSDIVKVL